MVATRKFSPLGAARLTRPSRRISLAAKKLSKLGKGKLVSGVAKFVLRQVPYAGEKTLRVKDFTRIKFNQSLSKKASVSIANKSPTGLLPCVERCTLAISLLRKSGVKAWLARVVSLDTHGKESIHDFVEFYEKGKVKTLSLGLTRVEGGGGGFNDTFKIMEGSASEITHEGGFPCVFRGIDSSQIGGATSSKKLQKFLRESYYTRQKEKEARRLAILISSGVIPNEAAPQLKLR